MASITKHYKISGPIEFLDVDVAKDNLLFVDPRAVRLERGPRPFATKANNCTTTFFDEVLRCLRSGRKSERDRGLNLLQHFKEPKETRLGMSKKGIDGHGGAEKVGSWIWQALSTDLEFLVRVGILKQVEDIPVFIWGIGNDITSDLTTRIIFEPLAQFTQAMLAKHPQFTQGRHRVSTVSRQVWHPGRKDWIYKDLELPVVFGRPLLLVPKRWVQHRLLLSSGRFYGTTMLSFAQSELSYVDRRTGKLHKDSKDVLKRKKDLKRGKETVIRVTRRAKEKRREDLLAAFKAFVDGKYEPLDDDEIRKRLKKK